ncbi:MAG: hypothetical protein K2N63_08225, partial [Lachnospiraceae bacterium]|nr:hypothetical protein [Lachnospiraceae bacterium]
IEQFIQASILLIILTITSFFKTDHLFLLLLTGGIFMFFITLRSLSEKLSWHILVLQFLLSIVHVLVSGNIVAYLIFYEFRICLWKHRFCFLRLILPSAVYFVVFFVTSDLFVSQKEAGGLNLPRALLNGLILFAAAIVLALLEYLTVSYLAAKNETARVVSVTALAELYEKKLNQELVMKNYLADKTARLEERENISRNIHNSVGHSVTAAIVALDACELLLATDQEKAREKLGAANRRIREGLDSIRQAVRILDEENSLISVEDFIGSLKELVNSFMMDTALKIRLDIADIPLCLSIPREYGEFLNGAVSELLTNGIKHGRADHFTIHLAADSAHIRIRVKDNGISDFSFANSRVRIENGYGLKKLLSFAKKRGGSVVFENNHGFWCMVTLPLYNETESEEK